MNNLYIAKLIFRLLSRLIILIVVTTLTMLIPDEPVAWFIVRVISYVTIIIAAAFIFNYEQARLNKELVEIDGASGTSGITEEMYLEALEILNTDMYNELVEIDGLAGNTKRDRVVKLLYDIQRNHNIENLTIDCIITMVIDDPAGLSLTTYNGVLVDNKWIALNVETYIEALKDGVFD